MTQSQWESLNFCITPLTSNDSPHHQSQKPCERTHHKLATPGATERTLRCAVLCCVHQRALCSIDRNVSPCSSQTTAQQQHNSTAAPRAGKTFCSGSSATLADHSTGPTSIQLCLQPPRRVVRTLHAPLVWPAAACAAVLRALCSRAKHCTLARVCWTLLHGCSYDVLYIRTQHAFNTIGCRPQ